MTGKVELSINLSVVNPVAEARLDAFEEAAKFLSEENELVDLILGINERLGTIEDPFEATVLQILFKAKLILLNPKLSCDADREKEIRSALQQGGVKYTIFEDIPDLLRFKDSFPHLSEMRNYQRLIDTLEKTICVPYGIEIPKSPQHGIEESYSLRKGFSIEQMNGCQLVIGCGHEIAKDGGCGPHGPECVFLNYSNEADPDICAHFASHSFWKEIPDSCCKELFLEGFGPTPSLEPFQQMGRILQKEGVLRLQFTEEWKMVHSHGYLEDFLIKRCGFRSVEIVNETFLSCGSTTTRQMIRATK